MQPESEVDVCVIGGGLAGIAAALSVKQAGGSVVVLEATDSLGGKAKTEDGLERGPQSFNGRYEVFWQLLDLLGLTRQAVELPKTAGTRYLARNRKLHALKPSPLTLFTTSALTAAEKLALLKDATFGAAVQPAPSIHDFFAQRFGESFAAGPVAAMISGIWAGDPRALSVEGCFPGLAESAVHRRSVIKGMLAGPKPRRRGIFRLNGGMGAIGAAAQRVLSIELGSPVRDLARDSNGFRVNAAISLHARSVVVATEAPVAARLLWPVSPKLGAALGQLEYAPLSVVHWEGGDARFATGFGYLACPGEGLFALGTLFHGSHFSTFVRGAHADDAALAAGVASDVRRLTGGALGRVLRIDRWEHAVFQPTVTVLPVRASLTALADEASVLLAGSYLGASAMKDALASGFAAGRRAHEAARGRREWSRSLS